MRYGGGVLTEFINVEQEKEEFRSKASEIKTQIKTRNGEDVVIVWDALFKNQEVVPIDLAIQGFNTLIRKNDKVISAFIKWLSKDGKTLSVNDLLNLYPKLSRTEFKIYPEDLGDYIPCGSLGNRGLACVADIIYDLVQDPGYHNIDKQTPGILGRCQYLFRKTQEPVILFVFEYSNLEGITNKLGIFFVDKLKFGPYKDLAFDNFKDLRNNLLIRYACMPLTPAK